MRKPKDTNIAALLTRSQLAKALGRDPRTIAKFVDEGMPVAVRGRGGRPSRYDLAACVQWVIDRETQRAGAENLNLYAERARLARAQAERTERENRLRAGELVENAVVITEGQTFVKGWRALVLALPKQLSRAGVITRDREPEVIAHCRRLLEEVARWKTTADVQQSIHEKEQES